MKRLPLILVVVAGVCISAAVGFWFGFREALPLGVKIDRLPQGAIAMQQLNALRAGNTQNLATALEFNIDEGLVWGYDVFNHPLRGLLGPLWGLNIVPDDEKYATRPSVKEIIMRFVSAWRARSSEASRSELEQSILRLLIAGLVVPYVLWSFGRHVPRWTEADEIVMWSMAAWLLIAIGLLVATWIWSAPNISRRGLGIILDVATITTALYLLDAGGSGLMFTYLFIIFGSGYRYGRSYLFLSQCVSLVGLLFVATNVSWWKSHPDVSIGWFIGLIFLPIYVGILFERLKTARAKAEEALKECIERQPRLS